MSVKPTVAIAIVLSLTSAIGSMPVVQAQSLPSPTQTKQSAPPPRGTPDNRDRAGTRSACGSSEVALMPMVPKTDGEFSGYTLNGHPSFWFYVDYNPQIINTGRFSLQDDRGQEIWSVDLELPEMPGLVKVSLPATEQPLKKNQSYRWDIAVFCGANNSSGSPLVSETGLVERIEDPVLENRLNSATAEQKITLYSERQIWYDGAVDLIKLRQSPQQWSQFLQRIGVETSGQNAIDGLILSDTPDKQ
jgi:Domain of Unknown Function (DUF928)